MRSCPVVDAQGRIYLCLGGRLAALEDVPDADEPREHWVYSIGAHAPGSPVLGGDGYLRIHSGDGALHCVDRSGRQVWAPVLVGDPLGWASPLVDDENGTWISGYNGGLWKVDSHGRTSGRPYLRSRQKFDCTGLIHRRVLYVGGEDGFVYAIDLTGRTGRNRWDVLAGVGKTGWFINSALAMTGEGELIVASRDDYLYGLGLDGRETWKVHMRGQMLGSPVVDAAGNVFVGINHGPRGERTQGLLVRVAGDSHKVAWQYAAAGPIESTPVVGDDGVVYFGDNTGTVHAVDPSGQPEWTEQLSAPVRSAGAIVSAGRVGFGLDNDTFVALKCSSRSLAPGGWPKYMGR